MPTRALIIGGSVGGLFAANLLRQVGWDTIVFERASEDLAGRGAAIGVTEELFEVLRRIGVRLDPSAGVVVRSIIALDRTGRITHEVARHPVTDAWARIYRPLKDALPPTCFRAATTLDAGRAGCDIGHRDLRRWLARAGRSADRRRRHQLDRAPTVRARGRAALRRLCGWRGIIEESERCPTSTAR